MSALAIKANVTINSLGTELYIEFLEATGVYNDPDNVGGFGAPNPERNILAMVLIATHKKVDGDQEATVLPYNVETVESYTITLTPDVNGVLNYIILAIPLFNGALTYVDGDVTYDNTNPSVPIMQEMVLGVWEERTAEQLALNPNVDKLNAYALPISDAIAFANSLNAQKLLKLRAFIYGECPKDEEYEPTRNSFEYVDGLIKNATNAFCAQAYNEAQIDIEEVYDYKHFLESK